MRTLIVSDKIDDVVPIGLLAILNSLRPHLVQLEWDVSGLEVLGATAGNLYAAERTTRRLATTELERLAQGIDQVIDGEFRGYGAGATRPTVILRAVDSISWDVSTDDASLRDLVSRTFKRVSDAGEVG